MKALILCRQPADWRLAGRTERSLRAAGVQDVRLANAGDHELPRLLYGSTQSTLLVSAGAWLVRPANLKTIPRSASGRPLLALGAYRHPGANGVVDSTLVNLWSRCLRACGGDLDRRSWLSRSLPEFATAYLEPEVAQHIGDLLQRNMPLQEAVNRVARSRASRALHLPMLDAAHDERIRVLQLITTIQIGGAERVALDLAEESRRQGFATAVAVFGAPRREHFPSPPDFYDLSHVSSDANGRAEAVVKVAREFGADVVHAHLIRGSEMAAIQERGMPVVTTLHNMPKGWPAGVGDGTEEIADLCIACSREVAGAAKRHGIRSPVRTVWNGIDPARFKPGPEFVEAGVEMRRSFGIPADAFVIAVIANPRRQKRLDRLPAILSATQEKCGPRPVRLLFVGAAPSSDDAAAAAAELQRQIDFHGVPSVFHSVGSMSDVRPALAASDVLLSVSDFEGLSVAILEALAAGLPVVATDVGGNAEVAREAPQVHLVESSASADSFATVLARIAHSASPRIPAFPASFTRHRMTRRYLDFYADAVGRNQTRDVRRSGVWLITNNFSTGGAQSSARRLLLSLQGAGIRARAAVVQEMPGRPTPGHAALLRNGLKVVATLPPDQMDAEEAVAELLDHILQDPPEAVLFWNLITSYKFLLAERLVGCRVIDVSPGEMYFDAMGQYLSAPRPGLPYRSAQEYGELLSATVVKYESELPRARAVLGCPVAVIPNGIPICDRERRRNDGLIVIGTAARLSPQKRLEDLLEALRIAHPRMPRYVLRVAGGPERGSEKYARSLRKLARGLPVNWCGELASVEEFLPSLDIFAMISEPSGCPNASLEAMAHGVPVIATAVGGAIEQIEDRVSGRLVAPRDPVAFADALVELAASESDRTSYGIAGQARVRRYFSMTQMLARYLHVCGLDTAVSNSQPSGQLP